MLVVRNAVETDITAIAELEKTIFCDAWTEKSIRDTFAQKQAFIVVAENEKKVVGYCIIYHVLDEAEIARIAVDSSCRRQGAGAGLLNHVSKICSEKEIVHLMLDVRESNETARAFYRGYGFQEDGIRKNFYEAPREHAVLMSKYIG